MLSTLPRPIEAARSVNWRCLLRMVTTCVFGFASWDSASGIGKVSDSRRLLYSCDCAGGCRDALGLPAGYRHKLARPKFY
jgi:hypothetical protein